MINYDDLEQGPLYGKTVSCGERRQIGKVIEHLGGMVVIEYPADDTQGLDSFRETIPESAVVPTEEQYDGSW